MLYDADCGFCIWTIALMLRCDRARVLRPVAIQSAEGAALLGDLTDAERLRSMHVVMPDAVRTSAGDALLTVSTLLWGGECRPVTAMRRTRFLVRALYLTVARRRHWWGKLLPRRCVVAARREVAAASQPPDQPSRSV